MSETGRQYSAGTVENSPVKSKLFAATGKKSGHGIIGWLPAPDYEMPARPSWPPPYRPPVVALLDTGVRSHPWLPEAGEPPFVLHAEDLGWQSPVPDDDAASGAAGNYGSHWGHATFIAGLIRQVAPGAQVLSMRVMNSDGKVREEDAAQALNWLADNPGGISIDIVLMAFGRPDDPADKHLDDIRTPIQKLSERGVWIVASAGNDGADRPVYPAAFAAESGLSYQSRRSVLSVGALGALATPTERAPYSNFGPWVAEWQTGTNVMSIMPLTTKSSDDPGPGLDPAAAPAPGHGYAWWSGTSFAAATAAGNLAASLPVRQALPEPATES
jgi:hypothetical protein